MLSTLMVVAAAHALPADVSARLEEVAPLRRLRLLDDAPALTEADYMKALSGKVATGLVDKPGYKARIAWGVGIVDVAIDRMWAAVNDDLGKVEYTDLAHVVLLEGSFCRSDRRVFQYLNVSLLSDRWWVVDQRQNTALQTETSGRAREVIWESIADMPSALEGHEEATEWSTRGIPVGSTHGAWLLIDLGDDRTLVEYHALSDPGGAVPARMASSFAAGSISNTITRMAELAVRGSRCL